MKWFLRVFPAVVLIAGALAYVLLDSKRVPGLIVGVGAIVWIGVGAVSLSSQIEPKDSGSSDG